MQKKTLVVVHEKGRETAVDYLKKLIETKSDITDGENCKIVGVEDGTVNVMSMTEKQWKDNKIQTGSSQKVVYIGDVREKKSLEAIMDILYDKHGVTIGHAGNQIIVFTSIKPLITKTSYDEFIQEFKDKTNIPATKGTRKVDLNWRTGINSAIGIFGSFGIGMGLIGIDAWNDSKLLLQQQSLWGVLELYHNHLDKFIKA